VKSFFLGSVKRRLLHLAGDLTGVVPGISTALLRVAGIPEDLRGSEEKKYGKSMGSGVKNNSHHLCSSRCELATCMIQLRRWRWTGKLGIELYSLLFLEKYNGSNIPTTLFRWRAVKGFGTVINIPTERSCHGKSLHFSGCIKPHWGGRATGSNRCTNSNADLTSEAQDQKRMSQIHEAEDFWWLEPKKWRLNAIRKQSSIS